MKTKLILLAGLFIFQSAFCLRVSGQGTAFTYQGKLASGGSAANGSYDLQFALYDSTNLVSGNLMAGPVTNTAVAVSNGLFTTLVDLGNAFTGASNWLEIAVSTNGAKAFSTLKPRQQVTPVPYALLASSSSNLLGTVTLSQLPPAVVTNNSSSVTLVGTFTGNGTGLTNLTSSSFSAATWLLATNLNGGYAALATNVVSGIQITNAWVTNSFFAGDGANVTNVNAVALNGLGVTNFWQIDSTNLTMGTCINTGSYSVALGHGTTASGNTSTAMGYSTTASGGDSTAMGYETTASGAYSTAMGILTTASGTSSTAMGDHTLAKGSDSTAMGYYAAATNTGCLVWADASSSTATTSTNNNSVTLRAAGGYRLFSNTNMTSGVILAAGGTAWSTISDRNAKKNFAPVNGEAVLDKLATVPVQQWNYKWEADDATPNLGPMAQAFKAAFYPGRDDKSITTLEFDGVELAAIQGLDRKLEQKETEIAELKARNDSLEARLEKLERLLEQKSN